MKTSKHFPIIRKRSTFFVSYLHSRHRGVWLIGWDQARSYLRRTFTYYAVIRVSDWSTPAHTSQNPLHSFCSERIWPFSSPFTKPPQIRSWWSLQTSSRTFCNCHVICRSFTQNTSSFFFPLHDSWQCFRSIISRMSIRKGKGSVGKGFEFKFRSLNKMSQGWRWWLVWCRRFWDVRADPLRAETGDVHHKLSIIAVK